MSSVNEVTEAEPMVMMISYDIRARSEYWRKYKQVNDFVRSHGISRMRVLKSQWVVKTRRPPDWWYNQLRPILGADDSLLVCTIDAKAAWGLLPPQVAVWLGSH